MRLLWTCAGFLALALGVVGIVLPLLPTVPFLLLAAFCFAESSPRLHNWLVNHAIFGPPIQRWRKDGAIGRKGKIAATISIAAVFTISIVLALKLWVIVIQAFVLCCVLLFIWTRPS